MSTPYDLIGGREPVVRLAARFYDIMDADEPALAKLHPLDDAGRVAQTARDRFALFLVGWLGGPQEYMEKHGHPRLRMRHGRVPIGTEMRDAWLRAMHKAMDEEGITAEAGQAELRTFLDDRFAHVANFLRNIEG